MKVLIKLAIGALLLNHKLNNKPMETSFIPLSAIIAILIIAFLFALRVRLFADVMLATLLLKMVTLANHRLHLLKLTLP